jgi:hypothetical protein
MNSLYMSFDSEHQKAEYPVTGGEDQRIVHSGPCVVAALPSRNT